MSKLLAVSLLLMSLCGCGKKENTNAPADDVTMTCANNLNQIDNAKKRWVEQSGAALTATPTEQDLDPWFRRGMPKCPGGGTYTIGAVSELPSCSIAGHNEFFRSHLAPPPQSP